MGDECTERQVRAGTPRAPALLVRVRDVTATAKIPKHGLDSMATVSLLLDLEIELSVEFPDQLLVAETVQTAANLWAAFDSLMTTG